MANKYYAVKIGLTPGIYDTWDECKANVEGYPGAVFKSFKTIKEANEYLGITDFDCDEDQVMPFSDVDNAIAYVDGSFNIATNTFGYGVVMFHNGSETHLIGAYDDENMASMRNVAGEIYGSLAAMEYAIHNGAKSLTIYYDYMGIEKWATGEWKTNKPGTTTYKQMYDRAIAQINIKFEKVKGHSGDKYNDLADLLAKEACGVDS